MYNIELGGGHVKISVGTVFVIMGSIFFGIGAVVMIVGIVMFFDVSADIVSRFLFLGCGALFTILGAVFLLWVIFKAVRRKKLIENGEQLTGVITAIRMNMRVTINGIHPYRAECEVIDPYSGERYLYSSDDTIEDISALMGMSVTVYTDPNDRKKYYMDISSLTDRYNYDENVHDYR